MNATTIGLSAATGGVTKDMVERAFAEKDVAALPVDAKPIFTALEDEARALIGLSVNDAGDHLGQWSDRLDAVVTATSTICG
ncbi:hypothetical protein [Nostocoides veronense]|uniref:Uncharacterized protein n=1 Tax=Nostocoides veronense TaxID=330836 RepID=A0ABN2LF03_9MICO